MVGVPQADFRIWKTGIASILTKPGGRWLVNHRLAKKKKKKKGNTAGDLSQTRARQRCKARDRCVDVFLPPASGPTCIAMGSYGYRLWLPEANRLSAPCPAHENVCHRIRKLIIRKAGDARSTQTPCLLRQSHTWPPAATFQRLLGRVLRIQGP